MDLGPDKGSRRINWTPEMDALLGTMTDNNLAEKIGCHNSTVWKRREQLAICAYGRINWTPEIDALLGTMPDGDLAERIGCSLTAVRKRRERLAIRAYKRVNWTPETGSLLATMRDKMVAASLGVSKEAVGKRRQSVAPDEIVGAKLGATPTIITPCAACGEERRSKKSTRGLCTICLRLSNSYGITMVGYNTLLKAQDGICAICGKTPKENGQRLGVDHDHRTGVVRGLLCSSCNTALGFFRDNPELLAKAITYLRRCE